MKRKHFLQSILGASASLAFPFSSLAHNNDELLEAIKSTERKTSGNLFGFKTDPIQKVRVGFIGMGNRGQVLIEMMQWMVTQNYAEVVAISDLQQKKVDKAIEKMSAWQKRRPKSYCHSETDWKNLVLRDDIDLLVIATPWAMHTPMSVFGMQNGKHVACEVPIAYTLSECWELLEVSERTKKQCIMLEN